MQAYSVDLRERVVADREAGLGTAAVAAKYRVSPAWVRRLRQRYRATGQVAPKRRTQYRPSVLAPYLAQRAALIEAQPAATLAELRAALGVPVSLTTVWRAVRQLGLTVKKNPAGRRTRAAGCDGGAPARARPGRPPRWYPPRLRG